MFYLGLGFVGVEHWGVGVWPEDLFVFGDDGAPNNFVLQIDLEFVGLADHRLEKFADVVGVEG